MKLKVLKKADANRRLTGSSSARAERNLDPNAHPFERARELVRATNAAKITRMVSRPFQGALSGHTDGVSTMARHGSRLNVVFSGSCDGEVRQWHLPSRSAISSIPGAHKGWVRGVCSSHGESSLFPATTLSDGAGSRNALEEEIKNAQNGSKSSFFLSCGDDCTVKLWGYGQGSQMVAADAVSTDGYLFRAGETGTGATAAVPRATFTGSTAFTAVDCSWGDVSRFVTSSSTLDVWDVARSRPIHKFEWGVDSILTAKYNPAQHNLVASTGSDRNLALYDVRQANPLRKLLLDRRSNAIAWNPMEPFNLTAANEDGNCYTYDMRKLDIALCVHRDHVSAVLSLDFSPTGREFATGSYDRTVRIFDARGGKSKEVYHTKRMQRVMSVLVTSDAKYVLSGSDDMNVRLWRMDASMPTRPLSHREKANIDYSRKLIEKHKYVPDVKRIHNQRRVPKSIRNATELKQIMRESDKRKEKNRRKHGADKDKPHMPERKKNIITQQE